MSNRVYLNDQGQKKYRLNGFKKSTRRPQNPDLNKDFTAHIRFKAQQLPPKVDLRPYMTAIEDQSDASSCVANAFAGAYEYLLKKTSGRDTDVSRLFIYYNARARDENENGEVTDEGCTVTSAIEGLKEYGTCLESIWPYDTSEVNTCPDDNAYTAAENNKIADAMELDLNLDEMKSCLAQGFPFAFGLDLYESFDHAAARGVVPMPRPDEQSRESHGCHAMLAVGYSNRSQSFIVRNSWGSDWGDGGYCYIPYQYMTNPNWCSELWAIRKLETDDMGEDGWDQNDNVNYHDDDENASEGEGEYDEDNEDEE